MAPPAFLRPFLPRVRLSRRDRQVILLLWGAGIALGWSQGEASALLPYSRVDLALSEGDMAFVLAMARVAAFGAIALGVAADRIGRRRPLVVALALLLAATGAGALSTTPFAYTVSQAVARIGGASVAALAVVVMAEGVTPGARAYAIGFFGAAASLGAGISVLTLPLAEMTTLGWRLPHLIPAVLLVLVPVLWRRLPESPLLELDHRRLGLGDLWRGDWRRRFLVVGSASLLASAFSAVGLAFTTERLIGDLGLTAGTAVLITVGGGTVGGVGFFAGGRLADGWGRRSTTILALLLALAGGLILFQVTTPWSLAAAAAVSAFGSFAFIPAAGAHRAELFPTPLRGAANSASNYLATVGSAVGLLVGGLTIDRYGLFTTMAMLGIGVVVAALLTARLPETMGQDLAAV